jgi:hypothetical protein
LKGAITMKRWILSTSLLLITVAGGASLVQAQAPKELTKNAFTNIAGSGRVNLTELLTQSPLRRQPGFSLMSASRIAKPSKPAFSLTPTAATPVSGSGMTGRIARWVGVEGTNTYVLGNSTIFEDKFGKVGIGTDMPTSRFTVAGLIETTSGGVKFPDGTVQTTAGVAPNDVVRSLNGLKGDLLLAGGANITVSSAGNTITVAAPNALTRVAHDATLTGDGTTASPLSVVQGAGEASQPVQVELGYNSEIGTTAPFTVPAGKRLVIEYVGAFYAVPTDPGHQAVDSISISTQVGSATVGHLVLTYRVQNDPPPTGFTIYHAGQHLKLYADPGTQVRGEGFPSNTSTGSVTISGHYVNLP